MKISRLAGHAPAVCSGRFLSLLVSASGDTSTMDEQHEDRRISSRTRESETVRIRPVESKYPDEIRMTLNVSWDGLYFATSIGHYFPGMVVYITRNYPANDPTRKEELGSVLRVDQLRYGRWGVAVHLPRPVR